MNLQLLRERAEKKVAQEYDAWADFTGAQRETMVFMKMLSLLESDSKDIWRNILVVAREAFVNGVWPHQGAESFVEFLCDVGGRYRQEDGRPSGTAYDLAGYVTVAWPVLESQGYNPVKVATENWSKARLTVSTMRKSVQLLGQGQEVTRPEDATEVIVRPGSEEQVRNVLLVATNEEISSREMMDAVCDRRVPKFGVSVRLQKDGDFDISAHVTEQQLNLVTRLLERYIDVTLE